MWLRGRLLAQHPITKLTGRPHTPHRHSACLAPKGGPLGDRVHRQVQTNVIPQLCSFTGVHTSGAQPSLTLTHRSCGRLSHTRPKITQPRKHKIGGNETTAAHVS